LTCYVRCCFFFQAEDGIRDFHVTGVQTCALPIFKTDPCSSHNVKGCNLAFWLDDYVRINGYFNGFTGWGWEDYEFAERLINSGVKKKRLKWAAVGFHIFHPLSSRANFKPNERIYKETVENRMWRRSPGFREVAFFKSA